MLGVTTGGIYVLVEYKYWCLSVGLLYKSVVNLLFLRITETSRNGIKILRNGLLKLDMFILVIAVRQKLI